MNLYKEKSTAQLLVDKANSIMIKNYNHKHDVVRKKDGTPVTEVDKMISQMINEELKNTFPDYGILDEERILQDSRNGHEFCWVIDPLDGTYDYLKGGKHFGTMIGLMQNYEPVLGVVSQPMKNGFFYAIKGEGAYKRKGHYQEKLKVSDSEMLEILVSRNRMNDDLAEIVRQLNPETVMMMPTSFKTLEIAMGKYNAFISLPENELNLWDLCAHEAILNEAGGKLTDFYGQPIDYAGNVVAENGVVATNSIVHDKVIKITSNYLRRKSK